MKSARRSVSSPRARRHWVAAGWATWAALAVSWLCVAPVSATPAGPASGAVRAERGPATTGKKAENPGKKRVSVRFENVGPGVTLRVDDGDWIPLARGQQVVVKVAKPHLRYTVARGTEWQYSAEVDLHHVRSRSVQLVPPGGHVRILNRSGEDRTISWNGSVLGVLKRGASRLYGPLSTGTHPLHATGRRSRDVFAQRVTLRHGGQTEVVLNPVPSGLIVPNPLPEDARASIDFQDYGLIRRGQRITVLGLAPGDHRIELVGKRSGKAWVYQSQVQTRGVSAPEAAALKIVVDNATGEQLRLPPAMAGLHEGPIAAGAKVTLLVARRAFRLRMTGAQSRLTYSYDVRPKAGAKQRWRIERPLGQLHLTNATGEPVVVDIDGRAKIDLRADQRLTVRKVPAGALQLRVTTKVGKRTFEKGVDLPPNGDVGWRVSAGRTTLIVHNGYAEQITLSVDGAPRGAVAPGAIFRLDNISAGPHRVTARTSWSKRTEQATVVVEDGARTRFTLTPPLASVRVSNAGEEPLDVVIRGKGVGTVEPGKMRVFSVASGRLVVAVHAVKSGRSASWKGTMAPGQHLSVPTPAASGSALLVRNPGATALQVRVDGGATVRIAAHASRRFADLHVGEHLVELTAPGSVQRQRIQVVAGQPTITLAPLQSP